MPKVKKAQKRKEVDITVNVSLAAIVFLRKVSRLAGTTLNQTANVLLAAEVLRSKNDKAKVPDRRSTRNT